MITRHPTKDKAYKDREYWFKQGQSVGVLHPSEEDEFYTTQVILEKPGIWKDRRSALLSMTLCLTLGAVLWVVMVAVGIVLVEWLL